jgi:hypothetical protein
MGILDIIESMGEADFLQNLPELQIMGFRKRWLFYTMSGGEYVCFVKEFNEDIDL